ncbi:MAG: hypothetical protein AAFZ01_01795 [Pseudomonadota bacterium]
MAVYAFRTSTVAFALLAGSFIHAHEARAAEPSLALDPRKPVIDVLRETRNVPAKTKPRRSIARTSRQRVLPSVAPASSSGQTDGALTVERILSRELPPPDVSRDQAAIRSPERPKESSGGWVDPYARASQPRAGRRVTTARQRDTGLPRDLWRGVTMKRFEALSRRYAKRPSSRAVRDIWVRLFATDATPPQGAFNDASFEALRMQGLYRLGAFEEIVATQTARGAERSYGLLNILAGKSRIALGDGASACADAPSMIRETGKVSQPLQTSFVEVSVYCALRRDDRKRAALMIELARDRGIDAPETFGVVDSLTLGATPELPKTRRLELLPGKLMVLGGYKPRRRFFDIATPALLVALANDPDVAGVVRLGAAEHAVSKGVLSGRGLRAVYLSVGQVAGAAGERAALLQRVARGARASRGTARVLRDARKLLDLSTKGGLYPVVAAALGPDVRKLRETGDARAFAETAVEVSLAAGDAGRALGWAIFGSAGQVAGAGGRRSLMHWQLVVDLVERLQGTGERGRSRRGLAEAERLAINGRFASGPLHRLVTSLDALGYIVPIPMWNAATRQPQPSDGALPETGVLSELASAAKARHGGLTLLLAVAAIGPDGAGRANLITLGDALRALRVAGHGDAATALAFEQIFAIWPRQGRR